MGQYLFFVIPAGVMNLSIKFVFLKNYRYGDSKDKERMVLQVLRKRESEMDGKMSLMRRVEHDGGRDRGNRKEISGTVGKRSGCCT